MNACVLTFCLLALGQAPSITLDEAAQGKLKEIAFQAARDGDVKTLEEYYKAGLPRDIRTGRGDTLLILAAYFGHTDALKVVLKESPKLIDEVNKMGFTALTGAAFKGDAKIAQMLLDHKANANAINSSGQTPLMFAAMMGREEVAKLLLKHGADRTKKTTTGETALSLAKQHDRATIVKLLENNQ